MKTLLLMRHAKSSWDDPSLTDHQRPLNRRGRNAAPRMGQVLLSEQLVPDFVLCSTATRTRETCQCLLDQWPSEVAVHELDELYHCPADGLHQVLQHVPPHVQRLLWIGHNPGLEDYLARFTDSTGKFPTAAIAWLTVDIETWSSISAESAFRLNKIWRPRE